MNTLINSILHLKEYPELLAPIPVPSGEYKDLRAVVEELDPEAKAGFKVVEPAERIILYSGGMASYLAKNMFPNPLLLYIDSGSSKDEREYKHALKTLKGEEKLHRIFIPPIRYLSSAAKTAIALLKAASFGRPGSFIYTGRSLPGTREEYNKELQFFLLLENYYEAIGHKRVEMRAINIHAEKMLATHIRGNGLDIFTDTLTCFEDEYASNNNGCGKCHKCRNRYELIKEHYPGFNWKSFFELDPGINAYPQAAEGSPTLSEP